MDGTVLTGMQIKVYFVDWHFRLQTMQKMQAAAGGKGRGANGAPTPAQIQAMQVRREVTRSPIYLLIVTNCSGQCRLVCCNRCAVVGVCRR